MIDAAFQTPPTQGKHSQSKRARQLKSSMGMVNILRSYDIHDAASYLEACTQINHSFYAMRSDLKETDHQLSLIDDRLNTMEQYKQHKAIYQQYMKQPDRKKATFFEAHRAGLTLYEAAERKLHQWKDSGEEISGRKWRECRKFLSQKRFVLEFDLRGKKDTIHYLEMVKHAFIEDRKQQTKQNERDDHRQPKRDEQAI